MAVATAGDGIAALDGRPLMRILVIFYSQSGEVAAIARRFAAPFAAAGAELTFEEIRPLTSYPYPWRSVRRFFDTMPESVLGRPPAIETPAFDPAARYDLVILAYPVWFLSPAPAIQGFFRSPAAAVLRERDVITITVSRAMWQRASEIMKGLLAAAGARHRDGIVVTHQGSAIATLISTPRTALFGRRDRLLGVFPKAGVGTDDLDRVGSLGEIASARLLEEEGGQGPLLSGEPAVRVRRWLVVPELVGRRFFRFWAKAIVGLGRMGTGPRAVGVYAFPVALALLILIGLPLGTLAVGVAYPLVRKRMDAEVRRLAGPTGEAAPGGV